VRRPRWRAAAVVQNMRPTVKEQQDVTRRKALRRTAGWIFQYSGSSKHGMIRNCYFFRDPEQCAKEHRRDIEYQVDRGRESCREGGLANPLANDLSNSPK
jgi:hypothetical protein